MSLKDKPIILIWDQITPDMREFIWKVLRDTSRPGLDRAATVLISLDELDSSALKLHLRWVNGQETHTREANHAIALLLRWLAVWEEQHGQPD